MKKILFTICVALLGMAFGFGASAQEAIEPVTVVKVNTKDGGITRFRLPSKPVVTVSGDKLVVTADELESLELYRSEVSHIDFEQDWTGALDSSKLDVNDFTFSYVDNATVMMAGPALTRADLFDVAGHKLATAVTDDGNLTLSLAGLPAGVYIVAPDCHKAVKIVKK